jgi:uroporphyrinogen decarboxylase
MTASLRRPGYLPAPYAQAMKGAERLLAAARRMPVDRTPVWFMRQAGRALPSYRELRRQHGMLEMVLNPELCTRITLMPVEQLDVDAAVLYSDITIPLISLGLDFSIEAGVGPVIPDPVRSSADLDRLRPRSAAESVPQIAEALREIHRSLDGRAATLGFAGAPFTLATYVVEGRASRDQARTKALMHSDPATWDRLMTILSDTVIDHLQEQVRAGAEAVQLFDSWAGTLSAAQYRTHVGPHSRRIVSTLQATGVPVIHFTTGTGHMTGEVAFGDVLGVDWREPIDVVWERAPEMAVQGNLDPALLLAGPQVIDAAVDGVLAAVGGRPGHIFNLGHGVLPETTPEALQQVVRRVRRAPVPA